jgi:hypothetical protein
MCPKSNLQKETKIHFTMQTCNILQPFIVLCKQKSRRDPCVRIRPRPERHEWTRQSPWPSPASVIRQPFLTGHRILHHLADGICRCHHTALVPLSHQDSGLEVLAYGLRDQRQVGVHCPAGEDGLPVAQALHGHKRRGCPSGSVRVWSRRTAGPDGEEFLPTVLRVLRHDVDELVLDRAARMLKTTPATAGLLRQFPCVLTMCSTSAVPVHATDLASW